MRDIIHKFKTAMWNKGIIPTSEIIADGCLHRFHVDGDTPHHKNGWFILHIDGIPSGAFGSWKSGITSTWCYKSSVKMSLSEQMQHTSRINEAKIKRDRAQVEVHERAAKLANYLWSQQRSPSA